MPGKHYNFFCRLHAKGGLFLTKIFIRVEINFYCFKLLSVLSYTHSGVKRQREQNKRNIKARLEILLGKLCCAHVFVDCNIIISGCIGKPYKY